MNVLTANEMAEADRRSVEAGVPIAALMEHAGVAAGRFVDSHYPHESLIVVLCGKGNNGGDGMVAARWLAENNRAVRIILLGSASELKADAADAWRAAKRLDRYEMTDGGDIAYALRDADVIVDAVVGTGFKPPLRGMAAAAKDALESVRAKVVAVDLPSGWDADSTEQTQDAFRADAVVTFTLPKRAHVFGSLTGDVFGPVVVAPIGTPDDAVRAQGNETWTGSAKGIAERPRGINGNKGKFGHVLIVGGALGKAGAPSMASLSALRAGAGLVTAAVPRNVVATVAAVAPELMLQPLLDSPKHGLSLAMLEGEDKLATLLKGITVVGIGPGLGQKEGTQSFVQEFLAQCALPMVIDADALNALAGKTELLKQAAAGKDKDGKPRVIVLTPHPGEMARLIGGTVKDVEADRVNIARRFATEHGVTLVLKGWRTLVAHPDGRIAVNTTGNPSMAKGGSGDILTGIVSAMLAQYKDTPAEAVEAAVYLHGLAGDFACLAQDEHTVLATDTVAHLWQAFRSRNVDADGNTWLTGLAGR